MADALTRDFASTLARLSDIGYRTVELDGLHGKSAADWKKALTVAGLKATSAHYRVATLQYDFDRSLDFAREVGLAYMICAAPRSADGVCPTFAEWQWNAGFLNTIGFLTAKAGIRLGYHNQGIEFTRYPVRRGPQNQAGVRTGFDEIVDGTDPALVTLQLDCGWAAAGVDPVALLERTQGRVSLLHIRDVSKGAKANPSLKVQATAVGQGSLDWKTILTAARIAGAQGYFVDLHPESADPLPLLRQSATFMQRL